MIHLPSNRTMAGLATTLLAALIIGCGGGGGGGGGSNNNTTATAGNPTTGAPSTNGSLTGGTDGGAGSLPADRIFYVQTVGASYQVRYVADAVGATSTLFDTVDDILAPPSSPDPSAPAGTQRVVFAASVNGSTYGIYRNATATLDGNETVLVTPRYEYVQTLQVSRDGSRVVFVAGSFDSLSLSTVLTANPTGTPTIVATGNVAEASLSNDGTKVVYTQQAGNDQDLFLFYFGGNPSGTTNPLPLTNDAIDQADPQFNKTGSAIVFAEAIGPDSERFRLATIDLTDSNAATNKTYLEPTGFGNVRLRAPSFNTAGTRVSFKVEPLPTSTGSDPAPGIYTLGVGDLVARQIVDSPDTARATYWTTLTGRSLGGDTLRLRGPDRR